MGAQIQRLRGAIIALAWDPSYRLTVMRRRLQEIGRLSMVASGGTQAYNGMLISIARRPSHGINLNANSPGPIASVIMRPGVTMDTAQASIRPIRSHRPPPRWRQL